MEIFQVEGLPDIDQQAIKKGKCPWCLNTLYDMSAGTILIRGGIDEQGDYCKECNDLFVGKLTIED